MPRSESREETASTGRALHLRDFGFHQRVRMVLAESPEDGGRARDLRFHQGAGELQAERLGLGELILPHPQPHVLRLGRRQLAAQPAAAGEQRQLDAMVQELGQRLGSHLDVAVDEDRLELQTGDLQEYVMVLLDDQPLTGLTDNGVLFRDEERGHLGPPCPPG